jgi:NAD+ kinase
MLWQVSAPTGQAPAVRRVGVLTHFGRPAAIAAATRLVAGLTAAGIEVAMPPEEMADLARHAGTHVTELHKPGFEDHGVTVELLVVLGGDGTILRGAEWVMASDIPLLGVNLGHVGFLAEAESSEIDSIVRHVVDRSYLVEERFTIDIVLRNGSEVIWSSYAINEMSIEKAAREKMLELMVEIDGRPLSRWACDGLLVATPTGSTAYAFSAGGPVIWPGVDALLVLPLSAHALFARPLVLGPSSKVVVELIEAAHSKIGAVLWCDGRRFVELERGMEIEVIQGQHRLRLARLSQAPFTDRLVSKFGLRVEGWRGRTDPDALPDLPLEPV